MSDDSEIIALLRELRDLQRAHFQRYQEFTAAVLKQQEQAAETQKKLIDSSARSREANEKHRLHAQEKLTEVRQSAARTRAIVWVSVVLHGMLVLALFSIILVLLNR